MEQSQSRGSSFASSSSSVDIDSAGRAKSALLTLQPHLVYTYRVLPAILEELSRLAESPDLDTQDAAQQLCSKCHSGCLATPLNDIVHDAFHRLWADVFQWDGLLSTKARTTHVAASLAQTTRPDIWRSRVNRALAALSIPALDNDQLITALLNTVAGAILRSRVEAVVGAMPRPATPDRDKQRRSVCHAILTQDIRKAEQFIAAHMHALDPTLRRDCARFAVEHAILTHLAAAPATLLALAERIDAMAAGRLRHISKPHMQHMVVSGLAKDITLRRTWHAMLQPSGHTLSAVDEFRMMASFIQRLVSALAPPRADAKSVDVLAGCSAASAVV